VARTDSPRAGKNEWLRRRYVRAGALRAAGTWSDAIPAPWWKLVEAIPGRLPLAVVDAIATHVRVAGDHFDPLCARLASEGRHPASTRLRAASGPQQWAPAYRLAATGNRKSQRGLLRELLNSLETFPLPAPMGWMEAIRDEALLGDLFQGLVQAHTTPRTEHHRDLVSPFVDAIRRIDGARAIAMYDGLLGSDPPPFRAAKFLRYERNAVVDDLLRGAGDEMREGLFTELDLPLSARALSEHVRR
jgi:hypothetical protein